MKSFKLTIILVFLLGALGYMGASFAARHFEIDFSNTTSFALVAFLLAPLKLFFNALKELRTDSIYEGLKDREKRRLESIINTKRRQLYLLILILVIPSIIAILGLIFIPIYRNELIYILVGLVFADVICVFHFYAVVDDVYNFRITLKNRTESVSRKHNVLVKLKD